MGRTVKTVSADGGSGSETAGLSSADVTTLIENNSEFTLIKTYSISADISEYTIPAADVDQSKYDVFRFLCKGNKWRASGQPYFYCGGNNIATVSRYGNGRNTSNGSNSYFGAQINSSAANFIMELTFRWINGYWHGNGWVGTARPGGYYDDFRIFDAITANASGGTYYTTNGVNMKNFNIGTGTGIGAQWDDKFYLYGMKKVSS